MRILRAAHLGMCFGVRDAIALALEHADAGPLTILGDLVHNPTVLNRLEARGIAVAQDVAAVKTPNSNRISSADAPVCSHARSSSARNCSSGYASLSVYCGSPSVTSCVICAPCSVRR